MFNYKLAILAVMVVAAMSGEVRAATTTVEVCGMNLDDMASCKPALIDAEAVPSQACCSALQNAKIPCLCLYKSYLPSLGINPELAMQLPVKCKLPNAKSVHC